MDLVFQLATRWCYVSLSILLLRFNQKNKNITLTSVKMGNEILYQLVKTTN